MWAIFGTFDVDNYGDLLFPVIARWRLGKNVLACSPTSNIPQFNRAAGLQYISFYECLDSSPSAILVGGGNILHFRRSGVRPYKRRSFSYAGLQVIPFLLKKYRNIPYLYNSPSVTPRKDWFFWRVLFRHIFLHADYLSFRDIESVTFVRSIVNKQVYFVPDTAFDISRVWAQDKFIRPVQDKYVAVHVNSRYGGSPEQVARALDDIKARLRLAMVFLPIGPCHGDLEYAKKISSSMSADTLVVTELDVHLFAQYIANSEMYLGSSMHGFITALSYGVKAALVLREEPIAKFEGVLSAAGLPADYYFYSWCQLSGRLQEVVTIEDSKLRLIHKSLDEHWFNLRDTAGETSLVRTFSGNSMEGGGLKRELYFFRLLIYVAQVVEKLYRSTLRLKNAMVFWGSKG